MSLKFFSVNIPIAQVMTFNTLAETEEDAMALVAAAYEGEQVARNRVNVTSSKPIFGHSQKRIRSAELGSEEEKQIRKERIYPASAMIIMEVIEDGY